MHSLFSFNSLLFSKSKEIDATHQQLGVFQDREVMLVSSALLCKNRDLTFRIRLCSHGSRNALLRISHFSPRSSEICPDLGHFSITNRHCSG